jgi:hypothetical protein
MKIAVYWALYTLCLELSKYHHLGHKTCKKIFPKKLTIFFPSLGQELSSKVLNTFWHAQLAKKNTVLQNQKMNIVVYTWRNKIYVRFLPFLLSGPKSLLRGRFELWKVPRAPLVAKRIILGGFQVLLATGGGSKATEAVSPAPDARPWPFFCCVVGSASTQDSTEMPTASHVLFCHCWGDNASVIKII